MLEINYLLFTFIYLTIAFSCGPYFVGREETLSNFSYEVICQFLPLIINHRWKLQGGPIGSKGGGGFKRLPGGHYCPTRRAKQAEMDCELL